MCRYFSEKASVEDKPIKFTTSKAFAGRKVHDKFANRAGGGNSRSYKTPDIQAFSVIFSVAVFLIYFCILREENDLDEGLAPERMLQRMEMMELKALKKQIQERRMKGQDVSAEVMRLKEIESKWNLSG